MFRPLRRLTPTTVLLVIAFLVCFAICEPVHAEKLRVHLTTPTMNSDGSPLTDLAAIRIEWGTCNGQEFGTYVAGVNFPITQIGDAVVDVVYPTGINPICLRCFAMNASKVFSAPSPTIAISLTAAGKPVVLN